MNGTEIGKLLLFLGLLLIVIGAIFMLSGKIP